MARTIAKDHDVKRQLIQDTAARVFAETGFDRASMSQLAKECGLSKAAIYHYYDSKDSLLFDILDNHLKALRDRVLSVPRNGSDPQKYLQELLEEILLAYRGADFQHRVQIDAMAYLPPEQQTQLRSYQHALVQLVSDCLIELSPDTLTSDKRKLKATTMSVFGMLNWFYMWNKDAREEARIEYANVVANLIMNGIKGV
ncbi:TetR/AcrR family transcriptional regulator [Polycladidibacter stylochi]|uniref:TetR/AcrR family transcriptional regulator n=1 Tax=Polycladidibacter stylochi TaxID=1807766 RepID=UPI00083170E0|nr:TetR/AcrR family transcriptional regulator [Pseudovibrio stylochi]